MFNGASLLILIALFASVWWLIFEVRYSRSLHRPKAATAEPGIDYAVLARDAVSEYRP